MASLCPLIAFSEDGEYVAYCGPEGSLKIWETTTGSLKQEYVPTSHLSSACTCLSWMPSRFVEERKRKKRKNEVDSVREKAVAMGTLQGKILLYSVSLGDLESDLSDGHADSVNDIQWNLTHKELFSCSHDGHIIQWDLHKRRPKSKWRADKGNVSRIVLCPDGETLLSAGKTINWWDIQKQQIIKKFTGHATQIIQLRLITFPDETIEDGYVVSAAADDRVLNVWQLKSRSRSALVSCNLAEDPFMFDVYASPSRTEKVVIASVTKTGVLQLFEEQLNGKRGVPKEAKSTLQIVDQKADNLRPIRILSCLLDCVASRSIMIAYDNKLKLCCEKLELSSLKENVCLVRSSGMPANDSTHSILNVKTPDTKHSKTTLSGVASNLPTQDLVKSEKKRKSAKEPNITQLPMDKRLSSLALDVHPGEDSKVSSENVVHLLMQGLHSNDETILDEVFHVRKLDAIAKTVQRLPIETIIPVIKELQRRIHRRWSATHLLAWIKFILITHTSYLATCSELHSILNPLYQVMDVKINLFKKMCTLKGKMDLIVARIESKSKSKIDELAIYSYQDESSDGEQSDVDDMLNNREDLNDLENLSESDEEDYESDSNEYDMGNEYDY